MNILERPAHSRPIRLLPHLITLANAGCGLLAISKGIDALALSRGNPDIFFLKMTTACWLVLLAMIFDALDGKVARLTGSASEYGGQLDSFSDFLTFGCAPALLAKVLIEHQGPEVGYYGFPRLHFVCCACFALMALLRLVRFNLENSTEAEAHQSFSGLPSPAAAGAVVSTLLLYLALRRPDLEAGEGTMTPVGGAFGLLRDRFPDFHAGLPGWILPGLLLMLVGLGLLMVSRVPYTHLASQLVRGRRPFTALIWVVFAGFLLFTAPVWCFFLGFNGYVLYGLVMSGLRREPSDKALDQAA